MPVNLEKILEHCRLCQLNPGTVHIIDNNEFIDQVFEFTKVKINDEYMHSFPKTVCPSCKVSIEEFVSFVKEVRLVDQKLHSQFTKCNESGIVIPEAGVIKEHLKTANSSIRFKCPVCPKTYARYRNLQLHKRNHMNLYCTICKLTFDDIVSRKSHLCHSSEENLINVSCEEDSDIITLQKNTSVKVESFKLPKSELSTVNYKISEEQENKKGPSKEWFEDEFPGEDEESCTKIKNEDCSEDNLNSQNDNEKLLQVDIIQKSKSKGVHLKTAFPCTYENCSKVCTSAYTLRTHLMKHEGKMPFLCVTCGKGFTTKNSLNCHEKIHAEVKAYVCKECDIGFSVASNLRAHQKKHHEGVRFYCSQCTREFITKCSLERHELVHTGIKEFKCESCQAKFYTNKELLKHQRYHQGLRLYKCDQCFKTFFEKHHLTIHIRVHTGERPYACKVAGCGKSFTESQKLSRHIKARHPPA